MTVEVGAVVEGKVTGITNFGAFVDFDGDQTGLVHISQISDKFIKDINDVLSVGDEVKAKVVKIGDDGKIALSMKALADQHEKRPQRENTRHEAPRHENHYQHDRRDYHEHNHRGPVNAGRGNDHFNDMLASYMKESESRLSTLKRQTDGKRGGRGGRRS